MNVSFSPISDPKLDFIHQQYVSLMKEFIIVTMDDYKNSELEIIIKGNDHQIVFSDGNQLSLDAIFYPYSSNSKFKENSAQITSIDIHGDIKSDSRCFTHYEIYDKWGNEVSDLTLSEYKNILRNNKIEDLIS